MSSVRLLIGDSVSAQPFPSLVGNCEEGAIGERSDGGAKPGWGWVSIFLADRIFLPASGIAESDPPFTPPRPHGHPAP